MDKKNKIFERGKFEFETTRVFYEVEYDKLYPAGSAPGSAPARFLCDRFSPEYPNDYSCKDNFSFVSQIKNANLSKKFLVSYDVTSLFTNIPLQEAIDIAINLIFNHNLNLNITKK